MCRSTRVTNSPLLPKSNRVHPLNSQRFCVSLHQDNSYWNFWQNNHNSPMSKSKNRWNERNWFSNENGFSSLDQKYVVCEVMLSIFVLLPFCHHVFSHIFPKDVNNIHKFHRKFCVTFFSRIQQNKVWVLCK